MKKLLQKKYINLIAIVGVLAIALLSYLFYVQIMWLKKTSDWVIHTYEVMEVTQSLLTDITFAENRQRNYFLSHDASYLESFTEVSKKIDNNAIRLQKMVQDNPSQYARSVSLSLLLKERLYLLNEGIKLYTQLGLPEILKKVPQGKGKRLMEEIRQSAYAVIAEEKSLLTLRINSLYRNIFNIGLLKLAAVSFSAGLIVFILWLANRQVKWQRQAEDKIRASEDELFRLAYYDTLTGLPNRTMIVNKLDQAIYDLKDKQNIFLFLIDIDHFKNINNSLSHEIGDELLLTFYDKIHVLFSENDVFSRLSGDEFAILAIREKVDDVKILASKIINSFKEPIMIRSHKIFITVSIGISVYPYNGLDAKTLMKNADIAMYRVKELGRNNYQFCTPEMALEVKERALLDYDLHQALHHNEFILLYQPKISLHDEKVIGIEALMRWNHPSSGSLSPENFIGLAESNGLIVPISEWLIRAVCTQIKEWKAAGLSVHNVAINISTRQFGITNFSTNIKNILAETGVDPQCLEFEITERVLMENSFDNFSALRELKDMGIKITIDDFGTGYSSLSYLRHFSIDKIKIDKSFIEEITESNPESNIIKAIIVMAHSLNISVVAEGVETAVQAAVLKRYGCDEVQGFLYNHPLPAEKIQRLLLP